jgi:exosortase/archaeosortase family protein
VPTDTALLSHHKHARNFALRAVAWSLGLFSLVRLSWFETHAVVPLTQLQSRFAEAAFGRPTLPVDVTLACSGADAIALCAAAVLAYPAIWPMRLVGAAGGIGLILALNTARIGTLGRAAASPALFQALHVYVWPAVLMLAIAGYVFTWMRLADVPRKGIEWDPFWRRFVVLTGLFLVLFTAASPFYLESTGVLRVAGFIARAAAFGLQLIGIQAIATANVLSTSRGAFLVTQECISTPLIPVYFAAVFAYLKGWRPRALALLAALPLFVGLGIARLLVVALPHALIGSPLFLIHAFYQLLLAATVVFVAAFWRHGAGATAWRRAVIGATIGGLVVYLLSPWYTHALTSAVGSANLDDPQGAIALLPSFQVGLYVALCVTAFAVLSWRFFVSGLAVLALSQIAVFAALHIVAGRGGFTPHVRDVRAWALAAPLLLLAAMVTYDRPRR